jgi:hypothetical protein
MTPMQDCQGRTFRTWLSSGFRLWNSELDFPTRFTCFPRVTLFPQVMLLPPAVFLAKNNIYFGKRGSHFPVFARLTRLARLAKIFFFTKSKSREPYNSLEKGETRPTVNLSYDMTTVVLQNHTQTRIQCSGHNQVNLTLLINNGPVGV